MVALSHTSPAVTDLRIWKAITLSTFLCGLRLPVRVLARQFPAALREGAFAFICAIESGNQFGEVALRVLCADIVINASDPTLEDAEIEPRPLRLISSARESWLFEMRFFER